MSLVPRGGGKSSLGSGLSPPLAGPRESVLSGPTYTQTPRVSVPTLRSRITGKLRTVEERTCEIQGHWTSGGGSAWTRRHVGPRCPRVPARPTRVATPPALTTRLGTHTCRPVPPTRSGKECFLDARFWGQHAYAFVLGGGRGAAGEPASLPQSSLRRSRLPFGVGRSLVPDDPEFPTAPQPSPTRGSQSVDVVGRLGRKGRVREVGRQTGRQVIHFTEGSSVSLRPVRFRPTGRRVPDP